MKLARQLLEEDDEDEEGTRDGPSSSSEVTGQGDVVIEDEDASQDPANGGDA